MTLKVVSDGKGQAIHSHQKIVVKIYDQRYTMKNSYHEKIRSLMN